MLIISDRFKLKQHFFNLISNWPKSVDAERTPFSVSEARQNCVALSKIRRVVWCTRFLILFRLKS